MSKDFKDTLLMMNTDFSMRASLPEKEPEIQKRWEDMHLYQKVLKKNQNNVTFNLHDGPPYANGDIHTGHALNKILKDFVLRYKTMEGFLTPYRPGWDTHGLPIETALVKNQKVNRKELSTPDFRNLCEQYALKQVETQKKQFRRLGILGDWDHAYLTLAKEYEAEQIRIFGLMVEKGLIYKGLKPVYWSPSSESALAEAEIEYHDKNSPSLYLAFRLASTNHFVNEDCEIVIWTTTPWTIPANLAVAVHPDYDYQVVKTANRQFVIAKELVESFTKACGYHEYLPGPTFKGKELEGLTYFHPLNNRLCPVVLADYVTLDSGTGLVHTAPGHGEDDFLTGKKYNLDVLCVVDEKGLMVNAGAFDGMFYEDANQAIVETLKQNESLLKLSTITHSYPHDWRTQKPIIFRATAQWFASIESLKEGMLEAIKGVKWIPAWGEIRIANMIKDRKEWCISRQRVWGVPIPVFYAEDGTAILEKEVITHISEVFAQEGSSSWWTKPVVDLLPQGYQNIHSPNGIFVKETDIMDVWFDSGTSHHSSMVLQGEPYPADLYLEGSDQYRGWFNSSLSTGVAITGKSPYKTILTHGFVLDGEGRKMSKSLGNTIDPNLLIKEFGADVLRLWVATVEYTSDVRISKDLMRQTAETYRKIRNTFRFLLGNLFDYDHKQNEVAYEKLAEVDQFMVCKLNDLIEKVKWAYENYRFDEVARLIVLYMTNELSAFYLDFTKDILYIEPANHLSRRSIQTVFYQHLLALATLLTPILPHTMEEVYQYTPNREFDSIYLLNMPKVKMPNNAEALMDKFSDFLRFRDDVLKALENARNNKVIGKSLSSKLVIYPTMKTKAILDKIHDDFGKMFIVSEFVIADQPIAGEQFDSGVIAITARAGHICSRCWKVVDQLSEDELCERCDHIIKKMEGK
ncbi:MAG: isoleucine--tRNA ligase [Bacilli bacterium]